MVTPPRQVFVEGASPSDPLRLMVPNSTGCTASSLLKAAVPGLKWASATSGQAASYAELIEPMMAVKRADAAVEAQPHLVQRGKAAAAALVDGELVLKAHASGNAGLGMHGAAGTTGLSSWPCEDDLHLKARGEKFELGADVESQRAFCTRANGTPADAGIELEHALRAVSVGGTDERPLMMGNLCNATNHTKVEKGAGSGMYTAPEVMGILAEPVGEGRIYVQDTLGAHLEVPGAHTHFVIGRFAFAALKLLHQRKHSVLLDYAPLNQETLRQFNSSKALTCFSDDNKWGAFLVVVSSPSVEGGMEMRTLHIPPSTSGGKAWLNSTAAALASNGLINLERQWRDADHLISMSTPVLNEGLLEAEMHMRSTGGWGTCSGMLKLVESINEHLSDVSEAVCRALPSASKPLVWRLGAALEQVAQTAEEMEESTGDERTDWAAAGQAALGDARAAAAAMVTKRAAQLAVQRAREQGYKSTDLTALVGNGLYIRMAGRC